jgi:PST family polysaccharide transporter
VRSTALIGAGAFFTLGAGVIAAKGYAILVGPTGIGVMALMQSAVNLGIVMGGFGLGFSVVQSTAAMARTGGNTREVILPGLAVGAMGGLLVAGFMLAFRDVLARVLFGDADHVADFGLLAASVVFSVAATVLTAYLSGLHDIRTVTAINVLTAVASAALGIGVVMALGLDGLALAVLLGATTHAAVATVAIWRVTSDNTSSPYRRWPIVAQLLKAAPPITGSQLASTGSQIVLPIIVIQFVGPSDLGLFRAASAITVGYLTFFLAALTQDYLPRLTRSPGSGHTQLIERRMRLIVGLGLPLILLLFAMALPVLEVLYAAEFREASSVLRWLLIGDLLRLPAWVIVFTLLGRGARRAYFSAEATGAVALILCLAFGASRTGIEGAAIGYAAAQFIYFTVAWVLLRRHVATSPGRLQVAVLVTAIFCAGLMAAGLEEGLISVVSGGVSIVAALIAWPRIYRLHHAGEL